MKQIFLWGAGLQADYVYNRILQKSCEILGMIDSNIEKQGKEWKYGLTIFPPEYLLNSVFDYIVVTPKKYQSIYEECMEMGISKDKVFAYWSEGESLSVFQNPSIYIADLEIECKRYRYRLENFPFEYGLEKTPRIRTGVDLLMHILKTKSSLCRFGDGEFELMSEKNRPWFQVVDKHLAERLREIIKADLDEKIIVAIADDFGSLDKYDEESADIIREYIGENRREEIMAFLDLDREYYDAYVTRPYILYKDKENAKLIFELFKKIWKDRNIILVEGRYARIGIGNDLLSDAASVKRVLCPPRNCWNKYREILSVVRSAAQPDDLICISLGPTATVMAYDLAMEGMQALDIGQLDNEYEWYLREAQHRIAIPGKMVAEVEDSMHKESIADMEYQTQIIGEIE